MNQYVFDPVHVGQIRRADIQTNEKRDKMLFIPVDWLFPTHSKVQKASRGLDNWPCRRCGVEILPTRGMPIPTFGIVSVRRWGGCQMRQKVDSWNCAEGVVCCSARKQRKPTQGFRAEWLFNVPGDLPSAGIDSRTISKSGESKLALARLAKLSLNRMFTYRMNEAF